MIDMPHLFVIRVAPLSTSRLRESPAEAVPLSGFQESPAEAVEHRVTESFWLKEAKASLRSRDPVDAAHDVEALARWADLQCGDILQTSSHISGDQNG